MACDHEGREMNDASTNQGMSKLASNHQNFGERKVIIDLKVIIDS